MHLFHLSCLSRHSVLKFFFLLKILLLGKEVNICPIKNLEIELSILFKIKKFICLKKNLNCKY